LPEIFNHRTKGSEAQKLYDDAQKMLSHIINDKMLHLNGIIGIFPANSSGDDIIVYPNINCKCCSVPLPQLRNQDANQNINPSLADFLQPIGQDDYLGLFAVTAGIGLDEIISKFRIEGDDYSAIMVTLLADRLAEAFAEHLHRIVRQDIWGYSVNNNSGIRPAIGYPCCPNHLLKKDIFNILGVEKNIGISLTEDSCMMIPTASVSGMIFAAPESKYFTIGKISEPQLEDYARRCNMNSQRMKEALALNIK
jgi:5-methyltetrahydrofolate--homocysteine methyltransferase